MSIARLDASVGTVVRCLVGKERRGKQSQKDEAYTYGRMAENGRECSKAINWKCQVICISLVLG